MNSDYYPRELPDSSSPREGRTSHKLKHKSGSGKLNNHDNLDSSEISQGLNNMEIGLKSRTALATSASGKNFKKTFYHFKNIYKIDDFKLKPDRQGATLTNLRASSEVENPLKDNTLKMVSDFKKNVATYLLMQKYNKEGSSKKFKQFYKKIKEKASHLNNNVEENFKQQKSLFQIQGDGVDDQSVSMMNMDNSKYSVVKGVEEGNQNHLDVEFMVTDNEGNQRSVKKKLDARSLQEKFIEKYRSLIFDEKNSSEYIIKRMANDYQKLLSNLTTKPFKLSNPRLKKPRLQDYNDYYEPCEEEDDKLIDIQEDSKLMDDVIIENAKNENDVQILEIIENSEKPTEENDKRRDEEDDDDGDDDDDDEDDDEEEEEYEPEFSRQKTMKKVRVDEKFDKDSIESPFKKDTRPRSKTSEKKKKAPKLTAQRTAGAELINLRNELMGEERESPSHNEANEKKEEEEKAVEPTGPSQEELDRLNRETLIDRLLAAPNIFDVDLSFLKKKIEYPKIPDNIPFKSEEEKDIFEKIFNWLHEIEFELAEERRKNEDAAKKRKRDSMLGEINFDKNKVVHESSSDDDLEEDEDSEDNNK